MIHDRVFSIFESIERRQVKSVNFHIGEWYAEKRHTHTGAPINRRSHYMTSLIIDPYCWNACQVLASGIPYPGDGKHCDLVYHRFEVTRDDESFCIEDDHLGFMTQIEAFHLKNPKFDLISWYRKEVRARNDDVDMEDSEPLFSDIINLKHLFEPGGSRLPNKADRPVVTDRGQLFNQALGLYGQQVPMRTYPSVQRNLTHTKDPSRKIAKPLVIIVRIEGEPARALVDSRSLGDFMSSTLVQQLGIKKKELHSPIPVQLAVQGSRSRINYGATAKFEYQSISETKYFDVINLSGYDLILGTPWLFQHQVTFGINPARVVVGSPMALPLSDGGVTQLAS